MTALKSIKLFGLLSFLFIGTSAFAQSKEEKAKTIGWKAIELMDQGKLDESIKLLKEAKKLDPKNYDWPYEIALAYYMKGEYSKTIKILEKLKKHENVTERLFQLLGNAYDVNGKPEKAFKAYNEGLELFPNSGMIYLEKGNVYYGRGMKDEALPFYEKGIEVDPTFPSNYYRATLIHLNSKDAVWGMIYGEIFMNLESGSKRTAEISELLYETYRNRIRIKNDTSAEITFSTNVVIELNMEDLKDFSKFKMPFGLMAYEPTMLLAVIGIQSINLNSLDTIRSKFLDQYYQFGHNKTYPNVLFEYQKKVKEAGHMEAYNHWILMKGDPAAFEKWQTANKAKWESFEAWFDDNRLVLDEEHKFYRKQY